VWFVQEANARQRLEAERLEQRLAEEENAKLEAKRAQLQREVEQKRRQRQQQQRDREAAEAEARVKEAERKRMEVDRELKEKQKQVSSFGTPVSSVGRPVGSVGTPVSSVSRPGIAKVPLKKDDPEDAEPKSNLNRSHSSPNIAKMFDDDNVYTGIGANVNNNNKMMAKPNFNRSSKPSTSLEISQARSRNFQGIWGTRYLNTSFSFEKIISPTVEVKASANMLNQQMMMDF
jgi:multidrug efflux pump subunit AcrA (membrane-fusion protein)